MPKKVCVIIKQNYLSVQDSQRPVRLPQSPDRRWENGDCSAPRPPMAGAEFYVPLPEHERLSLIDFETFDNVSQTFFITVPTLLANIVEILQPYVVSPELPAEQREAIRNAGVELTKCGHYLKEKHITCMQILSNLDAWKTFKLIKHNLSLSTEVDTAKILSAEGRLARERAGNALDQEQKYVEDNLNGLFSTMTAYRTAERQTWCTQFETMMSEFQILRARAFDFERALSEHSGKSNWLINERELLHPVSELCSYKTVVLCIQDAQIKLNQAAEKFDCLPSANRLITNAASSIRQFLDKLNKTAQFRKDDYLSIAEQNDMREIRRDIEDLFKKDGVLKQYWKKYFDEQSAKILVPGNLAMAMQTYINPEYKPPLPQSVTQIDVAIEHYARSLENYQRSRAQFFRLYEIPTYNAGEQMHVQSILDTRLTPDQRAYESFRRFINFFHTQIKISGPLTQNATPGSDWQYFLWSQYVFPEELVQNFQHLSTVVVTISTHLSTIHSHLLRCAAFLQKNTELLQDRLFTIPESTSLWSSLRSTLRLDRLPQPSLPLHDIQAMLRRVQRESASKLDDFVLTFRLDDIASMLKLNERFATLQAGIKSTAETVGDALSVAQHKLLRTEDPRVRHFRQFDEYVKSQEETDKFKTFTKNVSTLLEGVMDAFAKYAPSVLELTPSASEADKARFHTFVFAEPYQDLTSTFQIAITARNYVDSSFLPLCLGYLNFRWGINASNIAVIIVDQTQPEEAILANLNKAISAEAQLKQIILIVDQIHYMGACIRTFQGDERKYFVWVNSATSAIVVALYPALQKFCGQRGIIFTEPVRFRQYGANCAFYTLEGVAFLSRPNLLYATEEGLIPIRLARYFDKASGITEMQTTLDAMRKSAGAGAAAPADLRLPQSMIDPLSFESDVRKAAAIAKFQRVSHFGLRQRWGYFGRHALIDPVFTRRTEGQRLAAVIESVEILPDLEHAVRETDWKPNCFSLL